MTTKELITNDDGSQVMRITDTVDIPIADYVTGLVGRQIDQDDIQAALDDLQNNGVDIPTLKTDSLKKLGVLTPGAPLDPKKMI